MQSIRQADDTSVQKRRASKSLQRTSRNLWIKLKIIDGYRKSQKQLILNNRDKSCLRPVPLEAGFLPILSIPSTSWYFVIE